MKKIALITTNKILGQSFDSAIKSTPDLEFDLILLLNPSQALLDAEVLEIDIALIDMSSIDVMDNSLIEKEMDLSFCQSLNKNLPNCHLLLLVSQDDKINREIAIQSKKNKIVDDYVFYDASLKYLLAKLKSFG